MGTRQETKGFLHKHHTQKNVESKEKRSAISLSKIKLHFPCKFLKESKPTVTQTFHGRFSTLRDQMQEQPDDSSGKGVAAKLAAHPWDSGGEGKELTWFSQIVF